MNYFMGVVFKLFGGTCTYLTFDKKNLFCNFHFFYLVRTAFLAGGKTSTFIFKHNLVI